MTNQHVYALLFCLAAAPAAAQDVRPVMPAPPPRPAMPVLPAAPVVPAMSAMPPLHAVPPVPPIAQVPPAPVVPPIDVLPAMPPLPDMSDVRREMDLLAAKLGSLDAEFLLRRFDFDFPAAFVQGTQERDRDAERRDRDRQREAQLYSEGWNAAGDYRWDRALTYFNRVIELKGSKLDAALYWKAYSQNRLGQRTEALATIAELRKTHPNSSYGRQAAVLEAEVRRDVGQPVKPQDSADDEVKLMALHALQNTSPEQALPILERILEGTSGPKIKQRALFVLAQSDTPRAREVLRNYAKGSSTPELQVQAIQYLGVHGGAESRGVLQEIYNGSADVDVKRRILRSFMASGDRERLLKVAQGEQNAELRAEAVAQLGAMSAHEELWQLYQKESAIEVKRRIIRSMHSGGSVDRLIALAKSEGNPELRRDAIRTLGQHRTDRTGDVLTQLYAGDTNVEVRRAVVQALFQQDNATALVALARKEQDVNLRKEIVGRLANMRSKVATDYMLELLK